MNIFKRRTLLNAALGLVILAFPVFAQELSLKEQRKQAMYEFKMKHDNRWEIHWNKNTGTPASILGYKIGPFSGSPVAIAKQFLRAEKQMLGINSVDRALKSGKTTHSKKGGTRVRFSQTYKGIPVLNSGYLVAVDDQKNIYFISGDYYPELKVNVTQYLSPGDIMSIVQFDLAGATITYTGKAELCILPELDEASEKYILVYQLEVSTEKPTGDWRYIVDAKNGSILERKNRMRDINGTGDVYQTNPDHGGVVNRTIHRLRNISPRKLDGDNVIVYNTETSEASSSSGTFVYSPTNTHFDEVMAYYHSDEFEAWLINPVGMGTSRVPKVTIRTHHDDGYAHYHPSGGSQNEIHFSDGIGYNGLNNPTREAAVIAHEYMHRVSQTYNTLSQNDEADAMDEAYSDYFAVAYTNQFYSDSEILEYADQAGGLTHTRDLDNNHTYSEFNTIDNDGNGSTNEHDRSLIISGALWDLRNDISSTTADESILSSLDLLDSSPTFLDARNALKAEAPSQYSDEIDDAFAAHRIPLLTAYIWGPGLVYPGQQNTWDAGSDGDLGNITYQWYIKYYGSSNWTYLGSGSSVTRTFSQSYQTHQFRLVINSNGQSAEDIHTVVVWGGGFKVGGDPTHNETIQIPDRFALHQNYPNPFNPETEIKYELPQPGQVTLHIFNIAGQKIRTLIEEAKTAGYYRAHWDGRDESGSQVASGVYLYRLSVRTGGNSAPFETVKKMTLLR